MSGDERGGPWGGRPWHRGEAHVEAGDGSVGQGPARPGERVLVELVGHLDKVEGELALVRLDNGQVVSARLADVVVLDRHLT